MASRWLITLLVLLGASIPALSQDGGQVVGGSATITQPNSSTTRIDQTSGRAIINWNNFSIAPSSSVVFNQPTSSSVASTGSWVRIRRPSSVAWTRTARCSS